jgi:hypothetical protein
MGNLHSTTVGEGTRIAKWRPVNCVRPSLNLRRQLATGQTDNQLRGVLDSEPHRTTSCVASGTMSPSVLPVAWRLGQSAPPYYQLCGVWDSEPHRTTS